MSIHSNDIVLRVIAALDQLEIPYMLVGSLSSNAHGIARSTQDADFVIELGQGSIAPLATVLAPEIVIDPQSSFESVTMSQRFIASHRSSPFTVEFFLVGSGEFDRARFQRRTKRPFVSTTAWVPTAEDVIVQKLRWYDRAKRLKDWDDVRNVVAVQLATLDHDYIRKWCVEHGTLEYFEKIVGEIRALDPG